MATKTQAFIEMLVDDRELRSEFQKDPEAIIDRLNVEFGEDEREAVLAFDWNQSDEQLRQRVSKAGCGSRSDRRLKTAIRTLVG